MTIEHLLILVMEESSEIVQASSKYLRFGRDNVYLSGHTNVQQLSVEVGDLLGVLDLLTLDKESGIDWKLVEQARHNKREKLLALQP